MFGVLKDFLGSLNAINYSFSLLSCQLKQTKKQVKIHVFDSFYWNKQRNWLWTLKYNFKTHVMSKKKKEKCKLSQLVELIKKV